MSCAKFRRVVYGRDFRHTSGKASRARRRFSQFAFIAALLALSTPSELRAAARYSTVHEQFLQGKYEECLETASEEFERGVRNESWPRLLIRCQLELGRYEDASVTYKRAVQQFSDSLHIRMLGHTVYRYNNEPELAQQTLESVFRLVQRSPWKYSGQEDQIALGRYFLSRGEDAKEVLDLFFDRVRKADPRYVDAYVATAELALEKNDYKLAADRLAEAEKIDKTDPRIYYLTARAWADSDAEKAITALAKALELNPRHVPSLLQQVDTAIDAERYDDAEKVLRSVFAINPHEPNGWAYQAVIAHLRGAYEEEQKHREEALASWQANPGVDYLIGKKLSEKYRFAEAAQYQRRALVFDPEYFPAKFQLAQDLLRLGDETEGWELAAAAHKKDSYSVVAHNLVTLKDRLSAFVTLERDGFIVRMEAREARIYGEQVLDLLSAARTTLCSKYAVELKLPVIVEIFPQQKDFAIRTFGLPGGSGFLGVCFGRLITANSPAALGERATNWKSVLWHEFCHVVTLEKTHNRMPRWLSEGISVYEERQKDPTWGQSMTPQYREWILGPELTPIAELSGAFLNPKTPAHLQFAYYESSLVVEYLIAQHGVGVMNQLLADLGAGLPINEALPRYVGSLEEFNSGFVEFAQQLANNLGENVDWDKSDLPEQADADQLREWNKSHPRNYWGQRQLATLLVGTRAWGQAQPVLEELVALYPDDASDGSALQLLARTQRELGDTKSERDTLERLAGLDCDAFDAYSRLVELCAQAEDWAATAKYADHMLSVNPLLPTGHEVLARAGEQLDQQEQVVRSLTALSEMNPVDPAALHYRTAVACNKLGRRNLAKRHVLIALEEAPRYRDAQQLLLTLVDEPAGSAAESKVTKEPVPVEP